MSGWPVVSGLLAFALGCGELTAPTQVQTPPPLAEIEGEAPTPEPLPLQSGSASAERLSTVGREEPRGEEPLAGGNGAPEVTPMPEVPLVPEVPPLPEPEPPPLPEPEPPLPPGARPGKGHVVDLVAGFLHTCVLLDTGQVRCWGDRYALGYGASELFLPGENVGDDERPATAGFVELGGTVRKLSAGDFHTCALLDSGAVRCWGEGYFGELGYGKANTIGDDETPASAGDVQVGGPVHDLVAGGSATCAFQDVGVRCWGRNYSEAPALFPASSSPDGNLETSTLVPASLSPLDLGIGIRQIAVGSDHSCALTEMGAVRCWGDNADGRLGTGSPTDVRGPRDATDVDLGDTARQVAVGYWQSCAVLTTGNLRCWGLGIGGNLGYGHTLDIGDDEVPSTAGDVPIGGLVRSVDVRESLVCALLESGSVRCWGRGALHRTESAPRLADVVCSGAGNDLMECPGYVAGVGYGITGPIGDDETPAMMGDIVLAGRVTKLAVGGRHACVLLESGGVQCWGTGGSGQLGYGNTNDVGDDETPAAAGFVDVAGAPTVASEPTRANQISSGDSHSCAVLDSGTLRCWGNAAYGQLGYGNRQDVGDDEAPRSAGDVELRGHVRQVSARGQHTCAVLDSGAVRCWGPATNGVLGYGDTRDIGYSDVPASVGYVEVGGPARQVETGDSRTCAVLIGGALTCWGDPDDELQAMDEIHVGGSVRQVALGDDTCVLLEDGAVRCWGGSNSEFVGYGVAGTVTEPAQVPPLALPGSARQLSMRYDGACALLEDGSVHCWQQNSNLVREPWYEQLVSEGPPSQVTVELGARAVQVAASSGDGCAVLEDGRVRCWFIFFDELFADVAEPIDLGAPALAVSVAGNATCVLLETGRVRCWGSTYDGALGQPSLFGRDYVEASEVTTDIDLF